jgi:hypothetical protein
MGAALDRPDLPAELHPLRAAVNANLEMIAELGNSLKVSDDIVTWWRRMEWLRAEYEEASSSHHGFLADSREDRVSGWRRLFLDNAVHGVPRKWLDEYRAPKAPIAPFEVLAPIRLLGAELWMLFDRIESRENHLHRDTTRDTVDLARFLNHITIHIGELATLNERGTSSFDLPAVIHGLSQIHAATRDWERGALSTEELRRTAWARYQEVSAKTIFLDSPKAAELGLSVLEFNTEYSGLPTRLIPALEGIDEGLLIDPSLNRPQKGVGGIYPSEVTERVLRSAGCRVFLLRMEQETVGYYIFVPNPPSEIMPSPTLLRDLADLGLIKDATTARYGFFRGVSITEEARAKLHEAGVWGYQILDHQMKQTAHVEGCDTLVCTVRGGPNRNTSKERHLKLGWEPVPYEIRDGIPGGNPVEVLIRLTSEGDPLPQNFMPPAPKNWGENPHYRPHQFLSVDEPAFMSAATIADHEATALCEGFARGRRDITVTSYHGHFAFYIRFSHDRTGEMVHLQQLRPGFDLWYCSGNDKTAPLGQQLQDLARSV